jgi:hypothetical protein
VTLPDALTDEQVDDVIAGRLHANEKVLEAWAERLGLSMFRCPAWPLNRKYLLVDDAVEDPLDKHFNARFARHEIEDVLLLIETRLRRPRGGD